MPPGPAGAGPLGCSRGAARAATPMRRLAYPLLVLLAAALIALLGTPPQEDGGPQPVAPGAAPQAGGVAPATGAVPDGGEDADRRALDPPVPIDGRSEPGPLLRVRDARGEAPAAGARVLLLDPARLGERRAALEQLPWWELEARHADFGRAGRTDPAGELRLPPLSAGSSLFVRRGTAVGLLALDAPAGAEAVLELRLCESPAMTLEVLDEEGAAAAGVPVGLRPAGSPVWLFERTTDAHGRVVLEHLAPLFARLPSPALEAGVRLPLAAPPAVALDRDALEPGPHRLRLGPTGSVAVRVVGEDGAPPAPGGAVVLAATSDLGRLGEEQTVPLDDAGRAVFTRVGLGLRMECRFERDGRASGAAVAFPGPVWTGERVEHRLELSSTRLLLRGRVLDPDGAPRGDLELRARLERPSLGGPTEELVLRTEADGAFESTWPWRPAAAPPDRLVLLEYAAGQTTPHARAELALPPLDGPGSHALGDAVMRPVPALVSGVLLDEAGAPMPGRLLHVEEWVPLADLGHGDGFWQTEPAWSARTDADGAFVVRGRAPLDRVRLSFRAPGYRPLRQPFAPGDRGLVLRAERGAELLGRLLLPEGVDPARLVLQLRRLPNGPPFGPDRVADDGGFAWTALPTGEFSFRVVLGQTDDAPLAEVGPLAVQQGATTRDPRLDPVDLRDRIRLLRFRVSDPEGQPVAAAQVVEPGPGAARSFAAVRDGHGALLTARWPLDLEVRAEGYRPVRLSGVDGDREVVLRPGIRVTLRLDEPPVLDPGQRIGISLVPVAGDGIAGEVRGALGADGRVELVLPAAGDYLVLPALWTPRDRTGVRRDAIGRREEAARIRVADGDTPQEFAVPLDRAALRALLERRR